MGVSISDADNFCMGFRNGNRGYISAELFNGGIAYEEQIPRENITVGLIEFKIGHFTLKYAEDVKKMNMDYDESEAIADIDKALSYLQIFNKGDAKWDSLCEVFSTWRAVWIDRKEHEVIKTLIREEPGISIGRLCLYSGLTKGRVDVILTNLKFRS